MPITVNCPSCSVTFKTKDDYAGKRAKCPKCGEPLTIPAVVDTVLMPPPAKVAAPVAARPVSASKPKPVAVDEADEAPKPKRRRDEDDDDAPVSPKRKRGAADEDDNPRAKKGKGDDEDARPARKRGASDEDEKPRSRKRGDDADDDKPRSRRRRDDDDEPKKKSKTLPIILGIVGGLLLLCGGGCAGVYFGVIVPAAEKAKKLNDEKQAELNEWEKKLNPQAGGAELSATKLGQVRTGMTLQQVESVLGTGIPADNSAVVLATAQSPFELGASKRWSAKQRLGHVYSWDVFPNRVVVAFTADPKAGGTVEGVGGTFREGWSEPITLAGPGDGAELTAANVARLKAGMTQAEVQAVLGVGTKADIGHLGRCAPSLPPAGMQDAVSRWTAAIQRGVVRHWEHNLTASHVLVAYTADPTTGGTVVGVLAKVDFKGSEPVKLAGTGGGTPGPTPSGNGSAATPVATLTVDELVQKSATYTQKWVTVKCQVHGHQKKDAHEIDLISPSGKLVSVRCPYSDKNFAQTKDFDPLENLEVVGRVVVGGKYLLLTDAKIIRRSPSSDSVVTVAVAVLCAEVNEEPKAAATKYLGRYVQVTGKVNGGVGGECVRFNTEKFPLKDGGEARIRVVCNFAKDTHWDSDSAIGGVTSTFVGRVARIQRDEKLQSTDIEIEGCWVAK